jgi:integrase
LILEQANTLDKSIISLLAYNGLRIGALPRMTIKGGGSFNSFSKGKPVNGFLPKESIKAIKTAGLDGQTPFSIYTVNNLKTRVLRLTKKLKKEGLIKAAYSAHDFRHYFSVALYRESLDVKKVSAALNHSNISTTDIYLKTLMYEEYGD